jgi:hypothetical protein
MAASDYLLQHETGKSMLDKGPHDDLIEVSRRLTRDLLQAAAIMDRAQVRFLVDNYYSMQKYRIATAAQLRSLAKGEPGRVLEWVNDETLRVEKAIRRALGAFSRQYRVGLWLTSICGIGDVISAGLLAHLDIRVAKTAGHFWRFAGLDPTCVWTAGEKRPWNAALKTLCCFKLGESFVKVQGRAKDVYGKLYRLRKDDEIAANEQQKFAAAAEIKAKSVGKSTIAYENYSAGKLPPAHIHARARRYAVKIFISHLHSVMYEDYYGEKPPVPYVFAHCDGDHRHFIPIPNWPSPFTGKCLTDLKDGERAEPKPKETRDDEAIDEDLQE